MLMKPSLIAATLLLAGAAQAAPELLGTVTHDYGNAAGKYAYNPAGTCDTLGENAVTVRNTSGCQRFFDTFDFSFLDIESVDHFTLTISFSGTNGLGEQWRIRPAANGVTATTINNSSQNVPKKSGLAEAVYTLNASNMSASIFNTVTAQESFALWFNHTGLGQQNFNLHSASLEVWGTAKVPEPASLALVGLALAAAGGVARRRRAA